jgi:hypothetical protein
MSLLGATGCSSGGDEGTAEANEAYCAAVDDVRAEVAELQAMLAGDASRDDLSIQADSVRATAINAVLDAEDLTEVVSEDLKAAGADFRESLDSIADDAESLDEAKAQATAAAQEYLDEVNAVAEEAGCPAS